MSAADIIAASGVVVLSVVYAILSARAWRRYLRWLTTPWTGEK